MPAPLHVEFELANAIPTARHDDPPYAKNGDTIHGDEDSLPTSEELLLTQMDSLVGSLDGAEPRVAKLVRRGFAVAADEAWRSGRPRNELAETGRSWH